MKKPLEWKPLSRGREIFAISQWHDDGALMLWKISQSGGSARVWLEGVDDPKTAKTFASVAGAMRFAQSREPEKGTSS